MVAVPAASSTVILSFSNEIPVVPGILSLSLMVPIAELVGCSSKNPTLILD